VTRAKFILAIALAGYVAFGFWLGSQNASVETEGAELLLFALASVLRGILIPRWPLLLLALIGAVGVAAGGDEDNALLYSLILGVPATAILIGVGVAAGKHLARRPTMRV
jgi:hypothetical protein